MPGVAVPGVGYRLSGAGGPLASPVVPVNPMRQNRLAPRRMVRGPWRSTCRDRAKPEGACNGGVRPVGGEGVSPGIVL